ncbi:lipase/acyltransferase domain-containing protein [Georgenia daeguensis]|uniref:Lecithin:cholesterol acyltransferase n=1 Tax=Georgenia daeguensis TaxID=908355 RepID=A0ABP8EWP3_9MICO
MPTTIYVLLPGIVGSVLEKDGNDVFGLTVGAGLRALFSGGRSIQDLRLDPTETGEADDGVTATRIAADAHLIPGLWKIDGYTAVGNHLRRRLGAVPGETYFEFPYDWRLDNRVAARRLRDSAAGWLAAQRTKDPDTRLVLVAHSMGALVARYYLEVLGGWRDTRALISFGAPYRGSLDALGQLSNGSRTALGLVDLTELARSLPSVHQLLPIYPCLDDGTGALHRLTELAAPHLDPVAVAAARAFHQEIEDAQTANAMLEEYVTGGYRLHQVVGIDQPTNQSARLAGEGVELLRTYKGEDLGGDGTVPRVSATPLELADDSGAMFSGTRHSSLQNAPAVLTQISGWTSGVHLGRFRVAPSQVRLSVDLADVYRADEPVHLTVTPTGATGDLTATLEYLGGPEGVAAPTEPVTVTLGAAEGAREVELPHAGPGGYRVTVRGTAAVEPVSDLLVVAPR